MDRSTSYLRRAVDLVPSMIAYWDRDLRCRAANRAYETWFGVAPDALLGRSIRELLGPTLFALNEPHILGALRGEPQTFERVVPGPDGVRRHSLAHYLPDVVDGEVRGFVAHVVDVGPLKAVQSELERAVASLEAEVQRRQTAEETIVEVEQNLALTLASIGAGFLTGDRDGRVTRLNAVAERIFGWTEAEARGRSVWEVYAREGRSQETDSENPIELILRQGITVQHAYEVVAVSRTGVRTRVEVKGDVTRAPDGAPRGVALVFRDLTEREAAEARFRTVFEAAPHAMLMVDPQGAIELANRRASDLFGYGPESWPRVALEDLMPVGSRAAHTRFVAAFFGDPDGVVRIVDDVTARRRDGGEVPVEIALVRITMPSGPRGLASVVDLTERRRVEEELRRSNADLEQFAYVASHDMQEPLRMVASYTELLARSYQGRLDDRADKYLRYAMDGAQRLQRLVTDLLAYSRVGTRHAPLAPVDCDRLLRDLQTDLAASVAEAHAEVIVHPLPKVLGDDVQLRQLFQNLLTNAIKFRAERPIVVEVGAAMRDDRWEFWVQDNGIGFDMRNAERIFQMFQRLHAREKYAGSGIGLAIVRRIVEQHGGRVWVDSVEGEGTTFRFTLSPAPEDVTARGG